MITVSKDLQSILSTSVEQVGPVTQEEMVQYLCKILPGIKWRPAVDRLDEIVGIGSNTNCYLVQTATDTKCWTLVRS